MNPSPEHLQGPKESPTVETEPDKRVRSNGSLLVFFSLIGLLLVGSIGYQVYQTRKLSQQVASLTSQTDAGGSEADIHTNTAQPMPRAPQAPPFDGNDLDLDRWDPRAELQRMQQEMNQLFGSSFSRFHGNPRFGPLFESRTFSPSIDVEETADAYLIRVDVPGVNQTNIDIEVNNGVLYVRGKTSRKTEDSQAAGQIVRKERFEGRFERAIPLPTTVESEKMTSDYDNGVLTIAFPKKIGSGDSNAKDTSES